MTAQTQTCDTLMQELQEVCARLRLECSRTSSPTDTPISSVSSTGTSIDHVERFERERAQGRSILAKVRESQARQEANMAMVEAGKMDPDAAVNELSAMLDNGAKALEQLRALCADKTTTFSARSPDQIQAAVKLQAARRGRIQRLKYQQTRAALIKLQAACRRFSQAKQYQQSRTRLIKLQAALRGRIQRKRHEQTRAVLTQLQAGAAAPLQSRVGLRAMHLAAMALVLALGLALRGSFVDTQTVRTAAVVSRADMAVLAAANCSSQLPPATLDTEVRPKEPAITVGDTALPNVMTFEAVAGAPALFTAHGVGSKGDLVVEQEEMHKEAMHNVSVPGDVETEIGTQRYAVDTPADELGVNASAPSADQVPDHRAPMHPVAPMPADRAHSADPTALVVLTPIAPTTADVVVDKGRSSLRRRRVPRVSAAARPCARVCMRI